jgi:hypothetical protein
MDGRLRITQKPNRSNHNETSFDSSADSMDDPRCHGTKWPASCVVAGKEHWNVRVSKEQPESRPAAQGRE